MVAVLGTRTRRRLALFIGKNRRAEETLLLLVAVLVGLGTGGGAIIFRWLIDLVGYMAFEWLPSATAGLGRGYIVLAPTLGGLIVGPLIYFFAREAKGHGVPEVMAAVAMRGGRIRPIVALVKSLASSLSIGSGGSVGREGLIVQIGCLAFFVPSWPPPTPDPSIGWKIFSNPGSPFRNGSSRRSAARCSD